MKLKIQSKYLIGAAILLSTAFLFQNCQGVSSSQNPAATNSSSSSSSSTRSVASSASAQNALIMSNPNSLATGSSAEAASSLTSLAATSSSTITAADAEQYSKGQLYGSCTMQLDGNFKIVHNGAFDSAGKPLANVEAGSGGATWPVTYCPNSGSNVDVRCATGFKPVSSQVVQMICGANCFTYWTTYNCAKVDGTISVSKLVLVDNSVGNGTIVKRMVQKILNAGPGLRACTGPMSAHATGCLNDSDFVLLTTAWGSASYDSQTDTYSSDRDVTAAGYPFQQYFTKFILNDGTRAEATFLPTKTSTSLKWVYTNPTACVGPTPAPAVIGSACSVNGQTASNACGTATCQYE